MRRISFPVLTPEEGSGPTKVCNDYQEVGIRRISFPVLEVLSRQLCAHRQHVLVPKHYMVASLIDDHILVLDSPPFQTGGQGPPLGR